MVIEIDVKNKVATRKVNSIYGVCNNSDYTIKFNFDDEWTDLSAKTMQVNYGGESSLVVFTGDTCLLPVIPHSGNVEIGVIAGNIHTTTGAVIPFIESVSGNTGPQPAPTPDVYAQLLELASETRNIAQSVRDDADAGEFDGDKGDKGDKGDTGNTGNGISSIVLYSTSGIVKIYRITYTNGQTFDFTVKDGETPTIDQIFNPNSTNAQSGTAVEEAKTLVLNKTYYRSAEPSVGDTESFNVSDFSRIPKTNDMFMAYEVGNSNSAVTGKSWRLLCTVISVSLSSVNCIFSQVALLSSPSDNTPDYSDLTNKPLIENHELNPGNNSAQSLGLATLTELGQINTHKQDKFGEVTKDTSSLSVTVKLEGHNFVFSDENGNSVMEIPLTAYLQFIKGVMFNDVIFNNAVNLPSGSKINNHDIAPAPVIRRIQNGNIGIDTTISNGETLVCNGYPSSVSVTLTAPVISDTPDEYLCGIVFTPDSNFAGFTDSVSGDYTIVWEEEPTWTAGKVYEISYRCLWIFGTDGKIIISAKCSELTLPEASS